MNPLTDGIIASLIANGLTEISQYLLPGREGLQLMITESVEQDPPLAQILQKATTSVARSAHLRDEYQTEQLRMFFLSPEAEAIVRQIYGVYFAPEMRNKSEGSIRQEFKLSLTLFLGGDGGLGGEGLDALFDALLLGCERALSKAIERGTLSAHEAKSTVRHRMIYDELLNVKQNLELLQRPQRINPGEIIKFETTYRGQLVTRHGYITPPHVDVAHRVPIKDICVSPNLVLPVRGANQQPEAVGIDSFRAGLYRAVVLGNPGGGKSTLAAKLCYDLGSEYKQRQVAGRQLTPILVVLREYGVAKKEHGHSFVQFIETVANSHYQVPPPDGAIEYMMLNGRALVIFDGLDELLDTSHRLEICKDIECFSNLYPSVPILVTSREVGYEQAPLDAERFEVFRLAPFDSRQVQEYVHKWFAIDPDLSPSQQRQKEMAFLQESRVVADIRSNPLMLALMCNIYRGENYIPRNRPDVYEKCATMLFERWDKSRGIVVPLPIDAHIGPAMKFLAHWIYSDDKLQTGVTEKDLVAKTSEYLCRRRFEDPDEAASAARDFIEFCRGRAWVFTDMGTTKEGDRLYQFTHRTFLEYFTASHLVRTNPTPGALLAVLLPRVANREWDVVSQLAFQLQNKQVEGAGDSLLEALLVDAGRTEDDKRLNLLSFAARSLEFLVPSPRRTREVSMACLEHSFGRARVHIPDLPARRTWGDNAPGSLIGDLLSSTEENRGPIADCVGKHVMQVINDGAAGDVVNAIDIAFNLTLSLQLARSSEAEVAEEKLGFWSTVSRRICETCLARILELSQKEIFVALQCYFHGMVPLRALIDRYGCESLFRECNHTMLGDVHTMSAANRLMWGAAWGRRSESEEETIERNEDLITVGKYLLNAPLPWVSFGEGEVVAARFYFERESKGGAAVDSETLFGVFAIMAVDCETQTTNMPKAEALRNFLSSGRTLFQQLRWMLARWSNEGKDKEQAKQTLDASGFSPEQNALAWAWVEGKLDLVGRRPSGSASIGSDAAPAA